jgi:hypothetical protein
MLTVKSGLDTHMVTKLKDGIKLWLLVMKMLVSYCLISGLVYTYI